MVEGYILSKPVSVPSLLHYTALASVRSVSISLTGILPTPSALQGVAVDVISPVKQEPNSSNSRPNGNNT